MNQREKDANTNLIEQIQESAINIIQPVLERSMILAAEYAKACGRDIVLGEDVEYAMKYCAMNEVGKKLGTYFPDIDEEECSDEEIEEYEDVPFTRYSGREYKFVKMNMAYDNWNTWEPKNPSERILKNAIDSNEHISSRGMDEEI
jgi:histone H3/H4